MKYTSNVTKVFDGVVVLSILTDASVESTFGFHYTIQKSNGVASCIIEESLSTKNCSSISPPPSSKINQIRTPRNLYQTSIRNIVIRCAVNGSLITAKIINIPPTEKFGEMYTIAFPIGCYNMVQREIFDLAPAKYRFAMDRKKQTHYQ